MRKLFYPIASCVCIVLYSVTTVLAGNNDRAGQAGATELLINPWARCSGLGGANSGSIRGMEAMYLNIAGVAFTKKTEVIFANTSYFKGS